jgi:beta-aspartyl-peptidase (threonine type)
MKFSIAIHGGAGTITRALMTPEKELAYTAGLDAALACGEAVLKAGGTALDAVQAAVVDLENNHLFNAGRGSVFTNKGTHEMDAALMCGATLNAGAVAGIHSVKNPIALCRAVMDKSGHVFLAGQQAVDFAKLQGLELRDEAYFRDDFRYNQWLEVKDQEVYQLDHSGDKKFGTVGAVALDSHGNLAAATSTGGMTNKRWGRIGDSPVIGAGTYANNNSVAISCTGHGEYFIRAVVAYDISCLMEYAGMTLEQACEKVVMDKLVKMGGEGGLIAVDNHGNICLPFNSEGMYRGLATERGREVRIYKE